MTSLIIVRKVVKQPKASPLHPLSPPTKLDRTYSTIETHLLRYESPCSTRLDGTCLCFLSVSVYLAYRLFIGYALATLFQPNVVPFG